MRYALLALLLLVQSASAVEWLEQSTAVTIKMGPFVDDADGVTALTSLTLSQADFRLSKNGGNMAQKNESTSATHDEIGVYDVLLNTTDTAILGILRIDVAESGALPVWKEYMVVPTNTYDLIGGTGAAASDDIVDDVVAGINTWWMDLVYIVITANGDIEHSHSATDPTPGTDPTPN